MQTISTVHILCTVFVCLVLFVIYVYPREMETAFLRAVCLPFLHFLKKTIVPCAASESSNIALP